jgi:hypothetical protein
VKNATLRVENCPETDVGVRRAPNNLVDGLAVSYGPFLIDGVAYVRAGVCLRPVAQLVRTLRV